MHIFLFLVMIQISIYLINLVMIDLLVIIHRKEIQW